jgi:type IV pilus assembly protein PilA
MHRMINKRKDETGFTLIELLVVVVIIGVLVAIAVPVYLNYRQGAAEKAAQSDVRGAISAIEQYYTENSNTYPATQVGAADADLTFTGTGTAQRASVSDGTTLSYENNGQSYVVCGRNDGGNKTFYYNSRTSSTVTHLPAYANVGACITAQG